MNKGLFTGLKTIRDKLLTRFSTTAFCGFRCVVALVLMICTAARAPRTVLAVLWALCVFAMMMISLPREREKLQVGTHIAADTLLYITGAIVTPWMRPVLVEYVLGTIVEVLMRIRHKNRTGASVGILWYDCAASITLYTALFGMLLITSMTEFNFYLLSCLCALMRVSSQVAYTFHFITTDKEDKNPRLYMTNIEFQVMIMELLMALSGFWLFFSKKDAYLSVVLWKPFYVFTQFASIVGCIGIPSFFLGERLPRERFDWTRFPYRAAKWEKDGRIYDKIRIQKWKEHTPDMSRYMSKAFKKQGNLSRDPQIIRRMVQETCTAECVHWILVSLSWVFLLGMDRYGLAAMLLYIVGNLVSIIIQRYNRPRVVMLLNRLEKRNAKNTDTVG